MVQMVPSPEARPAQAPAGGRRPWMSAAHRLVPAFLLALALACGGSSSSTSPTAPGTAPSITAQPVAATTVTGRLVTLTVTATGAETLRYQWHKDGVDVLGAITATCTLHSPTPQDSGTYTVTVVNPNGSVTSSGATLTVQPAVTFAAPMGLAVAGNGTIYVADRDDHTIWKVTPTGQKSLLAGGTALPGATDGLGPAARFRNPSGLALDAAGNLLVADTGNHTLRRIAPDGTVTTFAGSAGQPGATDGPGATARFNGPVGLAVTPAGTVYVADALNHTLRTVDPSGTVATLAGTAGQPGSADGAGAVARFNQPNGLALAANGTLYVADFGNACLRAVTPSGQVTLLAGQASTPAFADGAATVARFNQPLGLAVDATGNLWVTDSHNHTLRRVTSGTTATVAGAGGTSGNADTSSTSAPLFNTPSGLALLPSGSLLVADTQNHLLRIVTPAGATSTLISQ